MSIKSLRLVVTPGDPRTFVEITTLNAAGQDIGYRGVLAAGQQYKPSFEMIWTPDSGPEVRDTVFGTGGTEPLWDGKPREEKAPAATDPDPGTGPNDGYGLADDIPVSVGSTAWIYDLGYRFAMNTKKTPNGHLSIKGHLDGVGSTQGVVLRIEGGRVRKT